MIAKLVAFIRVTLSAGRIESLKNLMTYTNTFLLSFGNCVTSSTDCTGSLETARHLALVVVE